MSYTALYRKYRPATFADVVGQDVVVTILKNSIINNKISHAYLFNGARGTGKTSIAKIFAKAVNCDSPVNGEACGNCVKCKDIEVNDIDIIEIDAASNNGVEEIREIRNKVKLMPSVLKYKVYIIDEVHMLSIGAFNALLKTIEEPPKHVIFILATTEINKIPLTILSRCQRFDFGKVATNDIERRLKYICGQENKSLPDEIILLIARLSDGGCRDAINLLDQILSLNNENITVKEVYDINGTISEEIIIDLFRFIYNNDIINGLDVIGNLVDEGKNLSSVVDGLLLLIRDISINLSIDTYFSEERKKVLNEFVIDMEVLKEFTQLLMELNNQLNKSTNQKSLFEIYYIYLTQVVNEGVKKDKVINTSREVVNSKEEVINNKNEEVEENKVDIEKNMNSVDVSKNVENEEEDDEMSNNVESIDNSVMSKNVEDNNELKRIRINNTLATASKDELKKILKDFDRISDFISNKVYNSIAALLLESKVIVASDTYVMFSFKDVSLLSVFYTNILKIEQFLNEVFDKSYYVVAVDDNEWLTIRNKFVEDKKNNVIYEVIPLVNVKTVDNNEYSEIESIAIDVFGEDCVESK